MCERRDVARRIVATAGIAPLGEDQRGAVMTDAAARERGREQLAEIVVGHAAQAIA